MAKPLRAQATHRQWRDLRDWLAHVDELGELKRVNGVNSEEDIGAITEMLDHTEESPCALFDEIANFEKGYRVLVNSMGSLKPLMIGCSGSGANCSKALRPFLRQQSNVARSRKIFCATAMLT